MPLQAGDVDPLRRLSCRRCYESYNSASDGMDALLPTALSRGQYGTKILYCMVQDSRRPIRNRGRSRTCSRTGRPFNKVG